MKRITQLILSAIFAISGFACRNAVWTIVFGAIGSAAAFLIKWLIFK